MEESWLGNRSITKMVQITTGERMARNKNKETDELQGSGETSMDIVLTSEHIKMIEGLVYHNKKMKMEQEAYSEDIKAVAQKMNLKPGEVKEMITWIIQEEEKGGVLTAKEKKLDFARQVLSHFDIAAGEEE